MWLYLSGDKKCVSSSEKRPYWSACSIFLRMGSSKWICLLQEVRTSNPDAENSLLWKIWPWQIRFVCPVIILGIVAQSVLG